MIYKVSHKGEQNRNQMTESRHQKLEDEVYTSWAIEQNQFNPEYEREQVGKKIKKTTTTKNKQQIRSLRETFLI